MKGGWSTNDNLQFSDIRALDTEPEDSRDPGQDEDLNKEFGIYNMADVKKDSKTY